MLRSPLKLSWLVAEKSEMDGLYRHKCWVKVLRSSLTPQDKIFSTRFHYKIKRKDGQFEEHGRLLVVDGYRKILRMVEAGLAPPAWMGPLNEKEEERMCEKSALSAQKRILEPMMNIEMSIKTTS
jgi:hypothetical protein